MPNTAEEAWTLASTRNPRAFYRQFRRWTLAGLWELSLNRLSPVKPSLLIGLAEFIPPWGLCQL